MADVLHYAIFIGIVVLLINTGRLMLEVKRISDQRQRILDTKLNTEYILHKLDDIKDDTHTT